MFDTPFSRRHMMTLMAGASALPVLSGCTKTSSANAQSSGPDVQNPQTASTVSTSPASTSATPQAVGQPMPGGVSFPRNPPEKKASDSLGFAIVGLGGYALRNIMPSFKDCQRAHISALVSGNADKCRKVANAYGVPEDACYGYDNFDAIANDDRIDAVYIILPSGLHAEYTERAFAAGKHVLCEKPMALSSDECQRMINAADAAGKKLMIGYRCHFEPHNKMAMDLMRDKAVGDIRMIRTNQHYVMSPTTPADNWRASKALAGYGPLEDYGIYGLQSSLYLTGEMPTQLTAYMHQPPNDPRFAEIMAMVGTFLKFPSGALAELSTSYDAANSNRGVVWGNGGKLTMDPATGYGGHNYTLETPGNSRRLNPGNPSVQFSSQMDHLADVVRDGGDILTPGEMGLRDIRLLEAIGYSAQNNVVVQLNPDGTMKV